MSRFILVFLFGFAILSPSIWAKAPVFSDFPVKEIYKGKNHPAQKGDEYRFDTLEQVLKEGTVNFAGHYIIYMDGCGTGGCVMYLIADARTGKYITSLPTPYIGDVEGQYAPNITYEANSKLIHVSGINAEKTTEEYQDDYYILENNHLKKIAGTVKTIKK